MLLSKLLGLCIIIAVTVTPIIAKGKTSTSKGKGNTAKSKGKGKEEETATPATTARPASTTDADLAKGRKPNTKYPGCNGLVHFIFVNGPGFIQSPNFPKKYKKDANCRWKLLANQNQVVKLHFSFFELEDDPDCELDSFTCYDGPDETAELLFRYCGSRIPNTEVLSTKSSVYCQFLSDSKQRKNRGFHIRYSVEDSGSSSGRWEPWSAWGKCTQSCGGGIQYSQRVCKGSCSGPIRKSQPCNEHECTPYLGGVFVVGNSGTWGPWRGWTACLLGNCLALQARRRSCARQPCTPFSGYTETRSCSTQPPCSNNGDGWTAYGACTKTCGIGMLWERRACPTCPSGVQWRTKSCNVRPCTQVGTWGTWSPFGSCSKTCGAGLQYSTRICQQGRCDGERTRARACIQGECDDGWGPWTVYGTGCTVTCGGGRLWEVRECESGGCPGNPWRSKICNTQACDKGPTIIVWSPWSHWSNCPLTCGNAVQKSSRSCSGGTCNAPTSRTRTCNVKACPECPEVTRPDNGQMRVNGFTIGSVAQFTCNNGYSRNGPSRIICTRHGRDGARWSNRPPVCLATGGRSWSVWSDWGECSTTCDEGVQEANRECEGNGDAECPGSSTKSRTCRIKECPEERCVPLSNPKNGRIKGSGTKLGSVRNFTCNRGYKRRGPQSIKCMPGEDGPYWSARPPTCVEITCEAPSAPENGKVKGTDYTFGSVVTFSCDPEYDLKGSKTRSCGAKGWGAIPRCALKKCVNGQRPQNVQSMTGGRKINDVRTFTCKRNYRLVGQKSITCELKGGKAFWSHRYPTCRDTSNEEHCNPLRKPANGAREIRDTFVGASMTFSCNTGFRLVGEATVTCMQSGEWSGIAPVCEPIGTGERVCGSVATLANGEFDGEGSNIGSTRTFTCDEGFELIGETTITCLADGNDATWSDPPPVCQEITCDEPAAIENGEIRGDDYRVGYEIEYVCDAGYTINGIASRECTAAGEWTGAPPTCVERPKCPALSAPSNGNINSGGVYIGDEVQFTCDLDYQLNGEDIIECQSDGNGGAEWSSDPPTCDEVPECPTVNSPTNGRMRSGGFSLGAQTMFTCNSGFKLNGEVIIICESDNNGGARWSSDPPTCDEIPLQCPEVIAPPNGRVQGTGVTRHFACNQGYRLVGEETITCQSDGQGGSEWSHPVPTCIPLQQCPDVTAPTNGRIQGTGSSRQFTCNSNYELVGQATITCQSDGQGGFDWSHPVPTCVFNCSSPPELANAAVQATSFLLGTVITYICNDGYRPSPIGLIRRTCTAGGWTSTSATCVKILCENPGAPANGQKQGSDHSFGSTVTFSCNNGYTRNGAASITCLDTGEWSDIRPVCELASVKTCPQPTAPANGQVVGDDFNVGSTITYSCDESYKLKGDATRTCQESGNNPIWSGQKPICELEDLQCGQPGRTDFIIGGRVVGGVQAKEHAWPWMAQLRLRHPTTGWTHWCGGVLISECWLLTAAHCTYDDIGIHRVDFTEARHHRKWRIVLGEHDLQTKSGKESEHNVTAMIRHTGHDDFTYLNDIALIKITPCAEYRKEVQPACLPTKDVTGKAVGKGIVTGWGSTDPSGSGFSLLLMQVSLPFMETAICNGPAMYSGRIKNGMFCAGFKQGGKDSCSGDSGGPLVYREPTTGIYYVVGLVSWGVGCAGENRPGVYTNVYHFLDWINNNDNN